ncbi:MAG TPA: class I SAM-dependent methyltransferase, partial [Polyangiales bacterium]|nr:class I SAM-dependent methyltransferase [Polyangiales bacterium]
MNETKLNEFVGKIVGDLGSTLSSILVVLGDRLGLWKALAGTNGLTAEALAQRTETAVRYVREWCNAQAAAGYLDYDSKSESYSISPEHAAVLADESSPAFFPGAFEVAAAAWAALDKTTQNFRTGEGIAWGAQHPCLFQGTERFFRSAYIGNLISSWIPALEGVQSKLERGAKVADVGCGVGASTILMARAFPKSRFYGFDSHAGSVELAQKR